MQRTLPKLPIKKKIADTANASTFEAPGKSKEPLPDSLDASLEAQAEALAASLPGNDEPLSQSPRSKGKSELARHRASQEEIAALVEKLPPRVREQMDELFRANYTRIQKLNIKDEEPKAT